MSDPITRATVDRLYAAWANDRAAIGLALAEIDPSFRTVVEPLAGGQLVLCGPGMYVNAACGCGRSAPLSDDDWARMIDRAHEVGVAPAIEIGPTTHPDTRAAATSRGFVQHDVRDAYVRPLAELGGGDGDGRDTVDGVDGVAGVEVEEIDAAGLAVWQQAAGDGFEHADRRARAVSDVWAHAALLAGDRMLVALDREDRRPLASAIVHMTDGVATLGGMSTVPAARGRGIQMLMLRHRLGMARAAGCDLASATAANPASARNLVRAGFERAFTTETWALHE